MLPKLNNTYANIKLYIFFKELKKIAVLLSFKQNISWYGDFTFLLCTVTKWKLPFDLYNQCVSHYKINAKLSLANDILKIKVSFFIKL